MDKGGKEYGEKEYEVPFGHKRKYRSHKQRCPKHKLFTATDQPHDGIYRPESNEYDHQGTCKHVFTGKEER